MDNGRLTVLLLSYLLTKICTACFFVHFVVNKLHIIASLYIPKRMQIIRACKPLLICNTLSTLLYFLLPSQFNGWSIITAWAPSWSSELKNLKVSMMLTSYWRSTRLHLSQLVPLLKVNLSPLLKVNSLRDYCTFSCISIFHLFHCACMHGKLRNN